MRRLAVIVATLPLLAACKAPSGLGCYAYTTKGRNDLDTYIVYVNSPEDAHVDWLPITISQEVCKATRHESGKTVAQVKIDAKAQP